VFFFCLIAFTFDDEWSITGRPAWVATARTYPAINAATNELVPLIAARRSALREASEASAATGQ
jgi:membrane protein required for colicin V production